MASVMLHCPPLTPSPSILILGLGGGSLPSFLHSQLPDASITAVDIDQTILDIAHTYFKLATDITTIACDGVKYVKDLEMKNETVDYLFVDIDSKDTTGHVSFPPMDFLSVRLSHWNEI